MADHTRNHRQVQLSLHPATIRRLDARVQSDRADGRRSSRSSVVARLAAAPEQPDPAELETRTDAILAAVEVLRLIVAHRAGVDAIDKIVAETWAIRRRK